MKRKEVSEKKIVTMIPEWYLDNHGTLFVSGEGRMRDFSGSGNSTLPPWSEVKDKIRTICFGEGITELGGHAFEDCVNLEKVLLPGTLSKIHHSCFKNCTKLSEVIVSAEKEFYHAAEDEIRMAKREVASRRRGAKLCDIFFGLHAFYHVPWALNRWGSFYVNDHVMYACFHAEKHVVIPEGVEVIRSFVFEGLDIESIEFPSTLKELHKFALANTKLKRVVLPEQIKQVEACAFDGSPVETALVPYGSEMMISNEAFQHTGILLENTQSGTSNRRYQEAYRLVSIPKYKVPNPALGHDDNLEYKKLYIKEKMPLINKETGKSQGMAAVTALSAGHSILRRLYRFMLMIRITYDEQSKTVTDLKSYRYYRNLGWNYVPLIYEMTLNPRYQEVDGTQKAVAGDVVFREVSKSELREKYFLRCVSDALVDTGDLHVPDQGIHEEWYCVKSCYVMKTIQEEQFLNLWLEDHPDYRLA